MAYYFTIRQDGVTKYVNERGKIAFPQSFENGGIFSEGRAPVCIDGAWGYINETGKVVIKPRFLDCHTFSGGMGRVLSGSLYDHYVNDRSRTGYVNRAGEVVIGLKYAEACDFSEGIAAVRPRRKGPWSYIDKRGAIVRARCTNATPDPCRDNRVHFEGDDGKYGFIDRRGKVVIPAIYGHAYGFHEGLAAVSLEDRGAVRYGFINPAGELVIPYRHQGALVFFSEGLAGIWTRNGFGFIDHAGRTVIRPKYYCADSFSCGRCAVQPNEQGLYGFIDFSGKMVIAPRFKTVNNFRNGLALVNLDGRQGYINVWGKFVWGPSDEEQW